MLPLDSTTMCVAVLQVGWTMSGYSLSVGMRLLPKYPYWFMQSSLPRLVCGAVFPVIKSSHNSVCLGILVSLNVIMGY